VNGQQFCESIFVMTVAALVLSVVAILVAAASAWYARRQAVSAEGAREIEAARRHDELHPILVGEYVPASDTRDSQRPGVKLTNQGSLDLDRVYVEVIPAHRAHEAAIQGSTITVRAGRPPAKRRLGYVAASRGLSKSFRLGKWSMVDTSWIGAASSSSAAPARPPLRISHGRSSSPWTSPPLPGSTDHVRCIERTDPLDAN
jgi:hypothetical protein